MSKQTKQISCQRPRQGFPSSKGTTSDGPEQPGAHVGVPVDVGMGVVVVVVLAGGGDPIEQVAEVLDDPRLELQGGDRSGGPGDEDCHGTGAQAGLGDKADGRPR